MFPGANGIAIFVKMSKNACRKFSETVHLKKGHEKIENIVFRMAVLAIITITARGNRRQTIVFDVSEPSVRNTFQPMWKSAAEHGDANWKVSFAYSEKVKSFFHSCLE